MASIRVASFKPSYKVTKAREMSHCLRPVNNAYRGPYADLGTLLSLFGADTSPYRSGPSNKYLAHHALSANTFIPNFDIIETLQAYTLEGELPGLSDKKAVDIEFTDHQTLLVKGRISKHTTNATTSAASTDDEAPGRVNPEAPSQHQPTVEDDVDEADSEKSTTSSVTAISTSEGKNVARDETKQTQTKTKPGPGYWITERSTGSFQRTFKFPGPIDQENVTAKLEDGILTIVVPKQTKVQTRKIEVH